MVPRQFLIPKIKELFSSYFFVEKSTKIFFLFEIFNYICINQKEILNENFNNLLNPFLSLFARR